ncbi:pyrroline-5-carboxylate reductase [Oceanicella actignis]|uniref:Pyrroline-5-carboxylate reductase n=1 Tax=Oceanicella actignis TaxID=1189325 RepID=A0A1M7T3T1_9RHOB|nr:pyrroline-5-carboxylate reductase [Oceanicella actignis]SET40392.1 pyrroline-5-carboxylate reductase [Oceanicella actignis]SHN65346.1 pyrroline-5-carboxylate reductase [Oceanicella actignis]
MTQTTAADIAALAERGVTILGCGKMGGAMLRGWLAAGLPPEAATVLDPAPADWLRELAARGLRLNPERVEDAAVCVLAVKPQVMAKAAPQVAHLAGRGALFMSIAAGTPISFFESLFGADAPIVRAMPNTPAAVGRGVTALIGNAAATEAHMRLAEALAGAVGAVVRLEAESQMDAVTAISGSGPAYVFHMIEAMAAAGRALDLPDELAMTLARQTVIGAAELARRSDASAEQLRRDVTSPGGTTAAALEVLMAPDGLTALMTRAAAAAARRSRELAG